MKSDLYWSQILTFLPNFPIPKEIFFPFNLIKYHQFKHLKAIFFPPHLSLHSNICCYTLILCFTKTLEDCWPGTLDLSDISQKQIQKKNTNAHKSHLTQDCHLYNTTITIFQLSTRAQTKCSARSKTLGLRKHTPKWNLFSKMRSFHFLF